MRDNIDEIPSGGIGIKIIGKIADKLSYTRTSDGRNCLLIVKYYQQPGLVPSQHSIQDGFFKRSIDVLNRLNFFGGVQKQRKRQPAPSSNEQVPKTSLQLKLNTDIKAVAQVLSWVEQFFFRSSTNSPRRFASV